MLNQWGLVYNITLSVLLLVFFATQICPTFTYHLCAVFCIFGTKCVDSAMSLPNSPRQPVSYLFFFANLKTFRLKRGPLHLTVYVIIILTSPDCLLEPLQLFPQMRHIVEDQSVASHWLFNRSYYTFSSGWIVNQGRLSILTVNLLLFEGVSVYYASKKFEHSTDFHY